MTQNDPNEKETKMTPAEKAYYEKNWLHGGGAPLTADDAKPASWWKTGERSEAECLPEAIRTKNPKATK